MIVEDDVKPLPNIKKLKEIISQMPNNWDIIYISFLKCGKKNESFEIQGTKVYVPDAGFR